MEQSKGPEDETKKERKKEIYQIERDLQWKKDGEKGWLYVGFKERPGVIEHFKPKIILAVSFFIFVIILITILCVFAPTPQHATIQ